MNRITNYHSFMKICSSNQKWIQQYQQLGSPKPFDVSLRDGLQSLSKEDQTKVTLQDKINIYKEIMQTHDPLQIEVGSLTSNKVLPIFNDSKDLLDYTRTNYQTKQHFMLIPNKDKLMDLLWDITIKTDLLQERDCKHISLITSVSNSFQKKNTTKNMDETRLEINDMLKILSNTVNPNYHIKLYISCVTECPIEGKINNDFIVDEILKYHRENTQNIPINNICLSDTMGTLKEEDFTYIVDKCNQQGVPFSIFSLHLHINKKSIKSLEKLFFKALDRKITLFDVSLLESGGCSVTMNKSQLSPNLSYDLYYEYLLKYIISKTI